MQLLEIINKHPEYRRLLKDLKSENSRIFCIREVSGVPFTIQNLIIKALSTEIDSGFLYASRDSLEIRKYIKTVQSIRFSEYNLRKLISICNNHNLVRVIKVLKIGEFALAGDVLSLWLPGYEHPLRLSFFGDDFETATFYDEVYGRKYQECAAALFGDVSVFDTIGTSANLDIIHPSKNIAKVALVFGGDCLDNYESEEAYKFDFNYPPIFFRRFDILDKELEDKLDKGFDCKIFTKHRLVLPKHLQKIAFEISDDLEAGIQSNILQILYLTDRELFGTIYLNKVTKRLTTDKARKMLAELEGEIEIDDYIVHEDYGIGIYKGIKQEKFEQKIQLDFGKFKTNTFFEDYILIAYAESDELYVPLSQINKITKYIGNENSDPTVTKLGKVEWQNIKKKVKADIEKMAKELVSIYAKRALANAPKIESDDSESYSKFINEFSYEETKDQMRADLDIQADLRLSRPMNRLIVGDVGFGKTEVAIRAAYRVCESGFQVAVLCPTTVLTAQHEKVFIDRFKNTPFNVAAVSRLSKYDNKKVVENLEQGKIDIVIGTHRLLSNDIKFKKLGLIIIDEEQKFGVKQKEKLKQLEFGVHVLSLSATPIPRTLSMALSSIQEVSLISTPPANRKEIITVVEKLDLNKVVAAINREVARGGQVYYLHNRVATIQSTYAKLSELLPQIKFVYAHGQMNPTELSKKMSDFYDKKYDCLICTTIIENGIDMPNVNTIIIEHAQNFGLGQLYQLRGRVGRSEQQAYAYLFYEGSLEEDQKEFEKLQNPDLKRIKLKELDYKKRLKAIMESQELGSGFRLASKDLEIRGAGNLLGKQQHGNIKYMGYGLYMQLLAEEIEKLKNDYQS